MSSVLSLAASLIVASCERPLLSVGGNTDAGANGPVSAARPAVAPRRPEPDAPPPRESVVVVVDGTNELAPVAAIRARPQLSVAVPVMIAAANDTPMLSPAANAAVDVLPLAAETIVAPSQAAYAYAQMMQAWLETRSPRPVAARPGRTAKARGRR